jgi:hypothetical protein
LLVASSALADTTVTPGPDPQIVKPAPPSSAAPAEDSISYTQGYSDGCASANLRYARQEHVKPNKDSKLYDADKEYHDGWDHGYRKCEDKVTPGGLSIPGNSVVM